MGGGKTDPNFDLFFLKSKVALFMKRVLFYRLYYFYLLNTAKGKAHILNWNGVTIIDAFTELNY